MKLKKYLNSKNISKILVLGILTSSISTNSFASVLSEDGRYETFEGDNIAINDILEEDKIDVEIGGNTLINLVQSKDYTLYNVSGNNRIERIIDGNFCSYKTIEDTSSYITIRTNSHKVVKPNTTYTVCFTIKKNTIPNYNGFAISPFSDAFFSGNNDTKLYYNNDYLLTEGIHKVSITTHSDISYYTGIGIGFKPIGSSCPENLEFTIGEIMVLEGDWTNKEIPEYFIGMKSVGENESNSYDLTVTSYENKILNLDRGTIASSNGVPDDRTDRIRTNLFQVSSDLISIKGLSDKESSLVFCYDEDKNYLGKVKDNWNTDRENIKLKENTRYVYVVWRIGDYVEIFPDNYKNVIIYENINNSYLEILLKEPLRSIPNVAQDKIIQKNGQWVVERNCGELILDGSEDETWCIEPLSSSTLTKYVYYNFPNSLSNIVLSNRAPYYDGDVHTTMVRVNRNVNRLVYISEVMGNISAQDVSKLREWLQNNPLNIVYQLDKPIYEPLNIDSTLNLHLNTTHISTNSNIPANLKFTVDRVANRAKEYSELVKENPTIGNISLARMWINLMRESLLKDEFHEDVNSIAEVIDMTLERKTVSANLDLYIKCENMLSMSIDTNVIAFEDFSGVEDIAKEDVINISINSSLPYNLNSYLATDIKSSDKSNSMDLDILSIKENSELEYQKFSFINNKLILKSNCESGNNKQHDIDLKLNAGIAHEKDVYKTTIKFEAEQI